MYIRRAIEIEKLLEKNKVLIIYGARQTGKTTLVKEYLSKTTLRYQYFTGDQIDFSEDFGKCDLNIIRKIVGNCELLVIDEAQKIENIGRALKLTVDNVDGISIIVTGSSSFDLANATAEPLTGRKNLVTLYPLSILELSSVSAKYNIEKQLEDYLIFGMYPNVITYSDDQQKKDRLNEIKDSYLLKDILEFQKVKSSKQLIDLLRFLAFQIGSEVSSSELGSSLGMDHKTVLRYLDLLEKSFVLFRLDGFSRNLRKEVTKMSKYYFYDLGIRNALIANFNSLKLRNDQGQLWENFILMERLKRNSYLKSYANYYFWRTYTQKEIDFIEEKDGILHGYEFKWGKRKVKEIELWKNNYPDSKFDIISKENFLDFVL